jgi:hypothetical protein
MENVKYNGWTNRDTWLVALWLNNEEKNYRRLLQDKNNLLGASVGVLEVAIKSYYYRDEINFNNVNWNEIKNMIAEL